jgi:hypothetical protein
MGYMLVGLWCLVVNCVGCFAFDLVFVMVRGGVGAIVDVLKASLFHLVDRGGFGGLKTLGSCWWSGSLLVCLPVCSAGVGVGMSRTVEGNTAFEG